MLTVIIPNYNHARFLPDAVRAVMAQSHPADEVIVVDDASTDNSVQVIESMIGSVRGARLVRNSKNLGVVANMNRALEMARGDLVAFAAADDVIYPQFLERAASLIEKFPVAAFVSGRTDIISVEGNRVGHLNASMPLDRPGYLDPRESARALMRIDSWFTGNVTLFRREPLLASGGFPEDLSAFTDGYVSRLLAVKHGVCFAPEIWGAWRRMEDGLAWSETEDFELLTRRMAAVERRMRESGAPFEPGYFHRWKNRSLFGARRFALANRRRRARERGLPAFVAACLREFLGSAVLFLRLRPWDVGSVLRRWLFQKNL